MLGDFRFEELAILSVPQMPNDYPGSRAMARHDCNHGSDQVFGNFRLPFHGHRITCLVLQDGRMGSVKYVRKRENQNSR